MAGLIFARWALRAAVVTAGIVRSVSQPTATFCTYNCSSRGPPLERRTCLTLDHVYSTQRSGWLLLRTRFIRDPDPEVPPPLTLPHWDSLLEADMTWEGHFRVLQRPEAGSMLMGTYGTNHDTDLYFIDASNRRRHAAVWMDSRGSVSLSTNVGISTGRILGPNVAVADGGWHHVAAVFRRSSGGALVTFSFKVDNVDYDALHSAKGLVGKFEASVKRVIARAADTTSENQVLALEDAWKKPLKAVRVSCTINVPAEIAGAMRDRLAGLLWLGDAVAAEVTATEGMWKTIPAGLDMTIRVSENTLPLLRVVGSAQLYVDGLLGAGTITYVPGDDNIGMDGQLLVGGGHRGRAVDCEVSRFRIWGVALALHQIQELRRCGPPSLLSLVGGPWPHGLLAAYPLDGSFADTASTGFSALESINGGHFLVGGLCSHQRCPGISPEGCMIRREVPFESLEKCDAFARYVHCSTAGANRGRPGHLTGCGTLSP